MSGGELTDYEHNLYLIGEWADRIEKENPILAANMHDLEKLLNRYDYYLSGDIGEEDVAEDWDRYRRKWITDSEDTLVRILTEKFDAYIALIKGGE